jgi:hypothetical protein
MIESLSYRSNVADAFDSPSSRSTWGQSSRRQAWAHQAAQTAVIGVVGATGIQVAQHHVRVVEDRIGAGATGDMRQGLRQEPVAVDPPKEK